MLTEILIGEWVFPSCSLWISCSIWMLYYHTLSVYVLSLVTDKKLLWSNVCEAKFKNTSGLKVDPFLKLSHFDHDSWTADKAIRELQQAGITEQCFPILHQCAMKVLSTF